MYKRTVFYFLTLAVISCQTGSTDSKQDVLIAKFEGQSLYLSEISGDLPNGLSPEDSAKAIAKFIDAWFRKQLLLQEARNFSKSESEEINRKTESYRNALIIYEWQKKTIEEQLDTTITKQEIEDFYNQNTKDFELKQNIVKAAVIKLAVSSKALVGLRKNAYRMTSDALKSFGSLYAEKYMVEADRWVAFEDFVKDTPYSHIDNKTDWLSKNNKGYIQEGAYIYFLKIFDYRLENRVSPLAFVKEQIKSIILNKRKMELLSRYEEELYTKALTEKRIEKL